MYVEHFGLTKNPFLALAEGEAIFEGPAQAKIISALRTALTARDSIAVVTGPVGVGKTTIVNRALHEMGSQRLVASLGRTQVGSEDIVDMLLSQFGVIREPTRRFECIKTFNRILNEHAASGARVFIAIEDAERLGPEVLEELEALTAADGGASSGANIILMGPQRLDKLIAVPELERVRQRVRLQQTLDRYSAEEVEVYLRHRIKAAGGDYDQIFEPGCAAMVRRCSGGIPRVINGLCETALTAVAQNKMPQVTARDVFMVAVEIFGMDAGEAPAPAAKASAAIKPKAPEAKAAAPARPEPPKAPAATPPKAPTELKPPVPQEEEAKDPTIPVKTVLTPPKSTVEPKLDPPAATPAAPKPPEPPSLAATKPKADEKRLPDLPGLGVQDRPQPEAKPKEPVPDSPPKFKFADEIVIDTDKKRKSEKPPQPTAPSAEPAAAPVKPAAAPVKPAAAPVKPAATPSQPPSPAAQPGGPPALKLEDEPPTLKLEDEPPKRADKATTSSTAPKDDIPTLGDSARVQKLSAEAEKAAPPSNDANGAKPSAPAAANTAAVKPPAPTPAKPAPVAAKAAAATPAAAKPAAAKPAQPAEIAPKPKSTPEPRSAAFEEPDPPANRSELELQEPKPTVQRKQPETEEPVASFAKVDHDMLDAAIASLAIQDEEDTITAVEETTVVDDQPSSIPDVTLDQNIEAANPNATAHADPAELDRLAAELNSATSLEDVSDTLAETLFNNEELEAISLKIRDDAAQGKIPESAPSPPVESAPSPAVESPPNPAVESPPSPSAEPAPEPKAAPAAPQAPSAPEPAPVPSPTPEAPETNIEMSAEPPPADHDLPPKRGPQPEPIESQINTSITATLKALSVHGKPPAEEDDTKQIRAGFLGRLKETFKGDSN